MDAINASSEIPTTLRQVKYLNNIVQQDHRAVKRVTKPMLNFKSFQSAKCVLAGIELMHMIRKGQLMLEGTNDVSFAVQFYALAGQNRQVRGTGIRCSQNHVHHWLTRQNPYLPSVSIEMVMWTAPILDKQTRIVSRLLYEGIRTQNTQSKMTKKTIFVTRPQLPPLEELIPYLEQIWRTRVLTNNGPFHKELEKTLGDYLGVEHLCLFTNGTIALVTALQALRITGEVITTPYSFVATSHALVWNSIKPVFVDIDPKTLNLDPKKIEAAITPKTTAILPVHCYGHPCDVDAIEEIARNYNLKVIYDAAHAFGVKCHCGSVLKHGDLSVLSFHATKVFNTFEGGAIVCQDAATKKHIDHLKNFGFVDETINVAAGINGKMSEFNAALGLLQLKYVDQSIASRREIDSTYRERLKEVQGIQCLNDSGEHAANYAYFPILVGADYPIARDVLYQRLKDLGVHTRRYFYPLISDYSMYRGLPSADKNNLPVATSAANQVLCLPIYPDLEISVIEEIVLLIANQL